MGPQPPCLALGCEPVTLAQEEQDIRGLTDEILACLQKRRRKRGVRDLLVAKQCEHPRFAGTGPGDVDIAHTGFFEREPYIFAAPLDRSPVVKLVTHGVAPLVSSVPAAN